ncbi:MAG: serine hydrolase [Paracoccaceae bacterium]
MKTVNLSLLFFLASAQVSFACNDANGPTKTRIFPSNILNAQRFADTIKESFDGNAMGYAVVLRGPDGHLLADVSFGWARTDCDADGPRAFDSQTVTSWASSSKVVAAAAILNKIERFPDTRSLDERLIDLFPRRWPVGACTTPGSCWSEATIAHALSHRAGFSKSVNTAWEDRFASGTSERPVGDRVYANESFAIFEYLGHFLAAEKMNGFENTNAGSDLADYSEAVRTEVRTYWLPYLQEQIFIPAGVAATCGDVMFRNDNYSRAYRDISDRSSGNLSTAEDPRTCTAGGVVISVSDMSKFLHTLSQTDRIISHELFKSEMARDDDKRLGFDNYIDLCDRLDDLDITNIACRGLWALRKNGGSRGVGSEILIFSDGSVAAFSRNSGWLDGADVDQVDTIIEAWLRSKIQGAGTLSIEQ